MGKRSENMLNGRYRQRVNSQRVAVDGIQTPEAAFNVSPGSREHHRRSEKKSTEMRNKSSAEGSEMLFMGHVFSQRMAAGACSN